jgi:hypothetical protein
VRNESTGSSKTIETSAISSSSRVDSPDFAVTISNESTAGDDDSSDESKSEVGLEWGGGNAEVIVANPRFGKGRIRHATKKVVAGVSLLLPFPGASPL